MVDAEIENLARLYAALYGGKIGTAGETVAFKEGKREGWWKYERGANNVDCITMFADLHWHEFIPQVMGARVDD